MASAHTQTVRAIAAIEDGALDGHGFRCTCGATQSTSLGEREARNLAWAHAQWHARRGS